MKVRFWHILILVIIGLSAALIHLVRQGALVGDGDWEITVGEKRPDELTLKWNGPIDPPMAQKLREAFEANRESVSRVVIELSSPGGAVDEGEQVIRTINRIKKTHRVTTYVGSGAICLSMCVPVYLQGDFRIAARDSDWMFHEVSYSDPLTGLDTNAYDFETRRATVQVFFQYFEKSEMNPRWRRRLAQDIRGQEVWKTGEELVVEKSGVVMVLD